MDDLLLKKLKSEYQYLKTEKEYQEQIFNKAQSEFKDYFNPKLGIQEPKPQKKHQQPKPGYDIHGRKWQSDETNEENH